MPRKFPAVLIGLLVLSAGPAHAEAPAGTWKLSIPGSNLTFLFTLEKAGDKWSGQFLGTSVPNFPKVTVADVETAADGVRLALKFQGQELSFDGKLPPDKNGRIAGSIQVGSGRIFLSHLDPSKLKSFDKYEFSREAIDQWTDPQAGAEAAIDVLKMASEKGTKIEEARGWADKAFKSASEYGGRWQRSIATRLAQALAGQKDFDALAVEYARKAERLLDDSDETAIQMEVLETVAQVLLKAGKAEDAKEIQSRLTKLEEKDAAEYAKKAPFKPDTFDGRQGKSDRAVLVELFTGAECPPCVAADLAFDGLGKTYKPTEVVLLQYHLHIPGPDPLTNPDTMARMQYYGRNIQGTPTIFVNGKPGPAGGGPAAGAKRSYTAFREAIDPMLEKDAEARLQLTATRSGDDLLIKANVATVARTGESIRLRLVLIEEHVRYQGGNGLRYHHCVVRAMPGGSRGFALKDKTFEHREQLNITELREKLNTYLTEYAENEDEFPKPDRPLNLKGLRVVAFVQDDDTNEVLQAVQAEVK